MMNRVCYKFNTRIFVKTTMIKQEATCYNLCLDSDNIKEQNLKLNVD